METIKCLKENGGVHKDLISGITKSSCNSCGWSMKRRHWLIIELLPSVLWVRIIKWCDRRWD